MVEHNLAKVGVASSSLVSRSCVAEWQSGYASACKAADTGSIPVSASIVCPGGGIGRRKGLKIPRSLLRAGSSPALGNGVGLWTYPFLFEWG